ncbi:MAG: PIN domain-containing protein [Xenococcaceae cyanobacterium]
MRVLVDTNIILDALLEREPFVTDARALLETIRSQGVVGYVTATTLTDIFYIVRRETKSIEQARAAVSRTLTLMEVCPVDRSRLEVAINSNLRDFEDAVQLACAIADNLEAIITRNAQDFAGTTLPILSVNQLLERLGER